MSLPAVTLALALAAAPAPHGGSGEALISLDVKEADVRDVVLLLAEVAAFQVVFDPELSCRVTLKLHRVRWQTALDMSLRSCRLGRDEESGVLRIAPLARLTEEAEQRRRHAEEKARSRPHTLTTFRLSYARAQELAPLLKRHLSPRGDVLFDARTNTLIIVD